MQSIDRLNTQGNPKSYATTYLFGVGLSSTETFHIILLFVNFTAGINKWIPRDLIDVLWCYRISINESTFHYIFQFMSTSRRLDQQMHIYECFANDTDRLKLLSSLTKGTKPEERQLFWIFWLCIMHLTPRWMNSHHSNVNSCPSAV